MSDLRKLFADPPTRYRGAPFWSWNDRLEIDELARQVRDMKTHGMGGFFMHSREGLETEYMSEEWLTCIRATVDAAKEAGTYAWLYDEDRWPSGAAGGLVQARGGDAYRAKAIAMEHTTTFEPADSVLALFSAQRDGKRLSSICRLPIDTALEAEKDHVLLVFRRVIAARSEWFNDDSPPDNLNPEAVSAFIDITYEAYYEHVGDAFGATVPGIFTDEPNFGTDQVAGDLPCIPWTDGLDAYFGDRRGYDLFDVLPYVFLDGEHTAKTRHDYWWTISERFVDAYTRPVSEWCEAHNLAFTGHYLLENTMGDAIVSAGSMMPHYCHQHVPGIDMLTVQTHENLTVKQCSSVAHQFGREFVLSELYGCAGWEMTFEDQKWSGDWQYVLGVNLRCQHLALYSLRGCRKRDYPPSFNYNTTWWRHNGVVEDYFARVGLLTTQGRAVRDVLVLHPVSTAWTMVGDGRRMSAATTEANAFGERINDFTRAVLAAHYDFDFGDEEIMAKMARVEDEMLWVNLAPYKVVVVRPGTQTLLKSTVDLLAQFVDAGGKVIAFDPVPGMVEAAADERVATLLRRPEVTVLQDVCQLQRALEEAAPRRVSICDRHGQQVAALLYMQRRDVGSKQAFFLVNCDRNRGFHVQVGLEGRGLLEEWDPLTGEIQAITVQVRDEKVWFEADLDPSGSRLYVLDPAQEPVVGPASTASADLEQLPCVGFVGPVCRFRRTDPNVLTLDVCRYQVGEGVWSGPMPVWYAQRAIRETLGMRQVYYNGLPQRYKWANNPHPGDRTPVALEFTFQVKDVPGTPVSLLLEEPADYVILLNGEAVSNEPAGWYLDRAFHKVTLPALQPGTNVLRLSCAYENRMEIEDCYLLGEFGVNVDRALIAEPDKLRFGDWCLQGYLHYPGSMVYLESLTYDPAKDGTLVLVLGAYAAISVAIHVNGEVVGHIPWPSANGFDLTPHLRAGENEIGIEVVGTPRNMLGPLHRRRGREPGTAWHSFRTERTEYTDEYVLEPYGLFEQVRVVRR
jgi:hypothetical protein